MMRRALAILILSLPAAPAGAPPPITRVRLFTPFQAQALAPSLQVTERTEGNCWTESIAASARPDAWRCMAGNRIYDPCFSAGMGTPAMVACPVAPWSRQVVLLQLKTPLGPPKPRKQSVLQSLPWGLELAGGARCTLLTGATAGIAGMRINYGCAGGSSIVGDPDRSNPTWRVFTQSPGNPYFELADVAVAWY